VLPESLSRDPAAVAVAVAAAVRVTPVAVDRAAPAVRVSRAVLAAPPALRVRPLLSTMTTADRFL